MVLQRYRALVSKYVFLLDHTGHLIGTIYYEREMDIGYISTTGAGSDEVDKALLSAIKSKFPYAELNIGNPMMKNTKSVFSPTPQHIQYLYVNFIGNEDGKMSSKSITFKVYLSENTNPLRDYDNGQFGIVTILPFSIDISAVNSINPL